MSDSVERLNAALEGRYTIERELGEGGMATVYLAEKPSELITFENEILKLDLAWPKTWGRVREEWRLRDHRSPTRLMAL